MTQKLLRITLRADALSNAQCGAHLPNNRTYRTSRSSERLDDTERPGVSLYIYMRTSADTSSHLASLPHCLKHNILASRSRKGSHQM